VREHVKLVKSRDIHSPFDFITKSLEKKCRGQKVKKENLICYLLDLWGTTRGEPTAMRAPSIGRKPVMTQLWMNSTN